jgi:hypothetical protein
MPITNAIKTALRPLRRLAGRFVIPPPSTETIFYKAAHFTSAEHVGGDFLEFGVFQGRSFISAFETLQSGYDVNIKATLHRADRRADIQKNWNEMRFFAFDSFQGLPAVRSLDTESKDFFEGQFTCGVDDFLKNLGTQGVDLAKVVVVPGWFQETCTAQTIAKYSIRQASIVHIDCDLYESAKIVLDFIRPILVDGTVIIFDDWYCFRGNPDLGEQRAFREWTSQLPDWTFVEFHKEGPWRNSFIACRKTTS